MPRCRRAGWSALALSVLAIVGVIALTSAFDVSAVGAHPDKAGLASTIGTLPGATDQATGVSCIPDGACIAVDYSGQVFVLSGSHAVAAGNVGASTFGVSCPTRAFCVMVSDNGVVAMRPTGVLGYTLAFGNGSTTHWSSISCSSSSFCMAGGGLTGGPEDGAGVVSRWNGRTWSPVRVVLANIPSEFKTTITELSCPRVTFCVAADQNQRVVQWDGKKWSTPSVLNAGKESIAASCTSERFCLAVSSNLHSAWTWDGQSWRPASSSGLTTSFFSLFVSCVSTTNCVATGTGGVAQRWSGRRWGDVETLYPNTQKGEIQGLACSSAGFCEAVTDDEHFIYLHDPHKPPRLPVLCFLGCKHAVI
jgi:hypothetical protein